jgi:hypothetical protein
VNGDELLDVIYSCDVICRVNPRTGEVERGVVHDESISGPRRVETAEGRRVRGKTRTGALAIATGSVDWPEWEVGF